MKKILAQAWKEFMLFRRDKLLILLAVLMPIVLMSLAGGTQSLRLRNVPSGCLGEQPILAFGIECPTEESPASHAPAQDEGQCCRNWWREH